MIRIILFFIAVMPCAGFSALQWLKRYIFNRSTMNEQDRDRVSYAFGITSPAAMLEQAWHDLRNGRATGEKAWSYELWKNVAAEWAKLDAHRAAFFLCLIAIVWFLVAVGEGIALVLERVL